MASDRWYVSHLGQHHQGEAQDVEQRQGGESQGGSQTPNHELISAENHACRHGRCAKHHGKVDGLDSSILGMQSNFALADLGNFCLKESLPAGC
jgi:hypothetical protein